MSGRLPEPFEIRTKLAAAIAAERRDTLLFSVLTVILTPAFVALSVLVFLIAVNQTDDSHRNVAWNPDALIHGTTIFLVASCASFFLRPSEHPGLQPLDLLWLGIGGLTFAILLALCYGSSLRPESPRVFWPLFLGLALLTLGLLGRGYVPRDHYYVQPGEWSIWDSPADREAEQADFWFGFASAFPGLILGSYGNIFGSWWLWTALDEHGMRTAADVLHFLGAREGKKAEERLRSAAPRESGRVLRWLVKLNYARLVDGRFGLTSEGERFLGISEWTV